MLTSLHIRNFKRFGEATIELGKTVVLIGPNNSGKTTVLQALALWDMGLRRWNEKRHAKSSTGKRPGVSVNRRDLISVPVPSANLLWRQLHVRNVKKVNGAQETQNIRIDIVVTGISNGHEWTCGMEFDYANEESFYCRPLRINDTPNPGRMPIPEEAAAVRVAYLPPLSGLADQEFRKEAGEIGVLIGQGQTAQVLRNLCYRIYSEETTRECWESLTAHIHQLFGVRIQPPEYIKERSEITLTYKDQDGTQLDISSSGRGLQQLLLLLAYLYGNPKTVLLLDEPDAHLEILRQRQTYNLLTELANQQGCQIIVASHSEIVLNEAADRDIVVAFVGKPHRIDDRGTQVVKALKQIGFDQYYQAEQRGWVLYLEGETDLSILQTFARTLKHPAQEHLQAPFFHAVSTNRPSRARDHFFGLLEAKPDLVGIAIFDRLDKELQTDGPLSEFMWQRREIENYLCQEEVLIAYAGQGDSDDLFSRAEAGARKRTMTECIMELTDARKVLGKPGPWDPDIKATDDFLDRLFQLYFEKLELPNLLRKSDYHILARLVPADRIDPEITAKLDAIVRTAEGAAPRAEA